MRGGSLLFCVVIAPLLSLPSAMAKGKDRPREGQSQRPMPTASLPIEPFSGEEEVLRDSPPPPSEKVTMNRPLVEMAPRSEVHDVAAALRVQMTQDGFGAQLRLLEFSQSWLAISQSLRYFTQDGAERLYERRYGLLLGLEVHPWRKARLSPFLTLQAGGERFVREPVAPDLDLFVGEAAAGLELQLNRLASFSLQWVGSYYNGLNEIVFADQKKPQPMHASLEVFFTMDWETTL